MKSGRPKKAGGTSCVGNDKLKIGLFKKILEILQKSQHAGSNHGKIVKELKGIYYHQTDPAEIKEYRKYFFSLLWQAMIVPFKEAACSAQERMIKCYTKFVLETGVEEDHLRPREDFPPFFTFCIRAYKDYHEDSRSLVRLRLIQLVHEILKEKHEDPFFAKDRINSSLKVCLLQRSKDVNPTIRAMAFKCLHFLVDGSEMEILGRLKFHSEFDPSFLVRKSAFIVLTGGRFPVRPSTVVKRAYDKSEAIRLEAFRALTKIPFGNIKSQQRLKLIQWGLLQYSASIKNIIVDELIPAWIADETYSNDVIKFFTHIDIARNSQTAYLLFRALLPDDSDETFQKLDLSFLNEDKLIPLESMVVEKVLYWRYICNLFKSKPYCANKIIPDPAKVIGCLEGIILVIHEENRKASEEDRDEEFEHILCLEQLLRIAELCHYEEASRRDMEIILRKILRDPILDEAVVIFTAVDLAHAVVEKSQFSNFMIEILQEIFEVESRTVLSLNQTKFGGTIQENSPIVRGDPTLSKAFAASVVSSESTSKSDENPKKEMLTTCSDGSHVNDPSGCENSKGTTNVSELNNGQQLSGLECILPCTDLPAPAPPSPKMDTLLSRNCTYSNHYSPPLPQGQRRLSIFTSTPARVGTERTENNAWSVPRNQHQEILTHKNELGELIAQRHRVRDKLELAVKSNNFMEAERCQNEINQLKNQERKVFDQIQNLEFPELDSNAPRTPELVRNNNEYLTPIRIATPSEQLRYIERSMNRHSRNNHSLFLNLSEDSIDFNENEFEANRIPAKLSDSLRGIVMLTRFLVWQDSVNPYVKMMYDENITDCLEEEDYRIRMYAMYLICMVGLIDKSEAKKALAVLIQGISEEEDNEVITAAFKCMVDLLLQHDYSVFLVQDEDEEFARDLPYPLNDSQTDETQLRVQLMKHLNAFAAQDSEQNASALSIKVLGMIKLLLRGRIDDESTIGWLLDLWIDESYIATPICFNIGHWLPLYISISPIYALRVSSAFLTSVKKIFADESSANEEDLHEKAEKLANFVLPHLGSHQEPLEDNLMVSERVVIMFLVEINRDVLAQYCKSLIMFTKLLEVQTKSGATQIFSCLKRVLSTWSSIPTCRVGKLISAIKNLSRQLEKKFGPLVNDSGTSDSEINNNCGSVSNSSNTGESDSEAKACAPKSTSGKVDNVFSQNIQNEHNLQGMIFSSNSELLGTHVESHSRSNELFTSNSIRAKRISTLRPKLCQGSQ